MKSWDLMLFGKIAYKKVKRNSYIYSIYKLKKIITVKIQ